MKLITALTAGLSNAANPGNLATKILLPGSFKKRLENILKQTM